MNPCRWSMVSTRRSGALPFLLRPVLTVLSVALLPWLLAPICVVRGVRTLMASLYVAAFWAWVYLLISVNRVNTHATRRRRHPPGARDTARLAARHAGDPVPRRGARQCPPAVQVVRPVPHGDLVAALVAARGLLHHPGLAGEHDVRGDRHLGDRRGADRLAVGQGIAGGSHVRPGRAARRARGPGPARLPRPRPARRAAGLAGAPARCRAPGLAGTPRRSTAPARRASPRSTPTTRPASRSPPPRSASRRLRRRKRSPSWTR